MNRNKPLVSVIIPSYNHAFFVKDTIQSVIDQDYENIELIIIDDGSKDNSVEMIKEMLPACEKRFRRVEFISRPNIGLCATLNEALGSCKGVFFSCIGSDDVLKPFKTSMQVKYLQENLSSAGVFGALEFIDENGRRSKRNQATKNRKYYFDEILQHRHCLPTPSQLLRLDLVKETGGYNEDLMIEDWPMWLFLTKDGASLDYVFEVVVSYRRHGDNMSSKTLLMQKARMEVLKLFASHPLADKALSNQLVMDAHELIRDDIKLSHRYMRKAFRIYKPVLMNYYFFLFFVRKIYIKL